MKKTEIMRGHKRSAIVSDRHIIDPDPEPLSDSEAILSLEGYGAAGALADDNLSINDMLMYAVQAEIDNIAMYEIFLSHDLPEQVADVFSALKSGSESHLLAFQKQVDRLG